MRSIPWIVFFILLSVNVHGEPVKDPFKNIQYFMLDNGMQVYLLGDNKAVNTQISMTVKVGTSVEDDKTAGLSHLVEHMVFRDQRIPHRDYLDYLEEEGASYVNGYTKKYETEYIATIGSKKSYWAVKIFARMLFDKQVSDEDLKVELGAIQTELGEKKWYEKYIWYFGRFMRKISPPKDNFHFQNFGLDTPEDAIPGFKAKENYTRVGLEEVLGHYTTYYYPANMVLKVAGHFDVKEMESVIRESFGPVDRTGTAASKRPGQTPVMNHKPYRRFVEGSRSNYGYIGTKYVLNDYKKYIILDAYVSNLAKRLQQHLRNERGATYSINPYHSGRRKAMVASVSFDGLRSEFETNIKIINKTIQGDLAGLDDTVIRDALKEYQKTYTSVEHDYDSLMGLIGTAQYLYEDHNISDKTSFEIFSSITPGEFRAVVANAFKSENTYSYIYRDYYFFPLEMTVLSLVIIVLTVLGCFKLNLIDRFSQSISYTKREVLMDRRLSNRFLGFLGFIFAVFLAGLAHEWIKYLGSELITGDPFYLHTIDVPYNYMVTIGDAFFNICLVLVIYRYGFTYYARMDVIDTGICLVGNRIRVIPKAAIQKLEVEKWGIWKFRRIAGCSLRFWKPLVAVHTKDNGRFYLRAINADHLEEDLKTWLN